MISGRLYLFQAKPRGTSLDIPRIPTSFASANAPTDVLPQSPNLGEAVAINLADFSVPPPNVGSCQFGKGTSLLQGNTGAIPKGLDKQGKLMQIISRIKDVYPNMTDEVALDYIMRTRQYMKQQGKKAKFPADVINYIVLEGTLSITNCKNYSSNSGVGQWAKQIFARFREIRSDPFCTTAPAQFLLQKTAKIMYMLYFR